MAFFFIEPLALEIDADPQTGELTTFRLRCRELQPRAFNVNFLKHQGLISIEQLQKYIKAAQPLMIPLLEGKLRDGGTYFQLQEGQIIPVDKQWALSQQSQQEQEAQKRQAHAERLQQQAAQQQQPNK